MSRFIYKLPDIGEGIAESEIAEWFVQVGDVIEEDQLVASMMTDKATVEMESPVAGTVIELGGEVGEMLAVGASLLVIETADADIEEACEVFLDVTSEPEQIAPVAHIPSRQKGGKVRASPAVRRRAKSLGIELADVPNGQEQVHHSDLDRMLTQDISVNLRSPLKDRKIAVNGVRRKIAERMEEAKRRTPHFTYVEEVDVTELERLRATLNRTYSQRTKLNLLPFFITALCRALESYPQLNAHYDDEAQTMHQFTAMHIGIAAATDAGLMVPVLQNASSLGPWEIADAIIALGEGARSGKLSREQLKGSTITVTSLGKLGGLMSTPILNRPEVAILAPSRIFERVQWVEGRAAPRKLMNISISCDHRVIDGHIAAEMVAIIRALLEEPAMLFIT